MVVFAVTASSVTAFSFVNWASHVFHSSIVNFFSAADLEENAVFSYFSLIVMKSANRGHIVKFFHL